MSAKKKYCLLPVSTGWARARIRHGSSDSRWTPLVAYGCHNRLIMLMPTPVAACICLNHVVLHTLLCNIQGRNELLIPPAPSSSYLLLPWFGEWRAMASIAD
ncbi:hypothetical protein GGI42DRAFT_92449 [Trichoderma sp. SZMC 28013]